MRWVDVTMPMRAGMAVWPGDAPFQLEPASRMAEGAAVNTSNLHGSAHAGTHMDAPWHTEEDGACVHELDPVLFFGEALVVAIDKPGRIPAEALPVAFPPRVLFKTPNSRRPADAPFREDFTALSLEAAERLAQSGVRLVGIDGPSIGPFDEPGLCVHHVLLGKGIAAVENVRLADVPPGRHTFIVLPLLLEGGEAAPCRAFVGIEEGVES